VRRVRNAERHVDRGWPETPVYRREHLPVDARLDGAAVIEQLDCTTVIEPGNRLAVDGIGNLAISL
jgi:N-methylhydantoinase A